MISENIYVVDSARPLRGRVKVSCPIYPNRR
jgi:hypothetical protein